MNPTRRPPWSAGRREPWTPSTLAVYLGGCLIFAVGADFFIAARMGTDPLDVFVLGWRRHVPITVGTGQAAVAAVCVLAWALWNRRRPLLSPFFTFLFCGSVIDVLMAVRFAEHTHLPHVALMTLAGLCCAYGSSLIIMSGLGIRAMDLVALTMRERWRWPFWCAKGSLEGVLLTAGWLLGGPVGVGTVFFLVTVDLLIQPMVRANHRYARIPNLGMRPLQPADAGPII